MNFNHLRRRHEHVEHIKKLKPIRDYTGEPGGNSHDRRKIRRKLIRLALSQAKA